MSRRNDTRSSKLAAVLLLLILHSATLAQQADLVVVNADIRTLDARIPRAAALAVTGGKITAVGTNRQIGALVGEKTRVIDAQGKLVLPGFNDAHVHFAAIGAQFFSVNLKDAKTPAEAAEKIRFHARFLPPGQWIIGSGWNNENWTPGDLPTKDWLNSAAPDNPVFLYHENAQTAVANTFALKLAGLDRNAPLANEIARDADGNPTGILNGAAMRRVRDLAPLLATDDKAAVLETASNYAAAFGVTSVQDVSADDLTDVYRDLARQNKLKTRVYDCIALADWKKLADRNIKRAEGDAMIRRGCLKGTAESDVDSTAALARAIRAADKAGLQIMIHAIGARSNERILSIFERVFPANGGRDRRHRVEHAHGLRSASDIRRLARAGLIASMQPFLFSDAGGKTLDPLRDFLNNKTPLAFGSDASMIEINPLLGIAAAVNASDARQSLSVEEAVRAYTLGSAYAEFEENAKGSLAVGKLADFVVLSQDIYAVRPEEIQKTVVIITVMDGKVVYQK